MDAVGFLELNSIAKGVEAADAVLKAADTRLLFAKTVCPGKYNILFTGDVAAVSAALDCGKAVSARFVVDSVVIPRIHPQVIAAINQAVEPVEVSALGILEFYSVTASVYGADAAVKAADVQLLDVRLGLGIGGKSYVVLCGDVAAVTAAVKAGSAQAVEQGLYLSGVVIPRPQKAVFDSLL